MVGAAAFGPRSPGVAEPSPSGAPTVPAHPAAPLLIVRIAVMAVAAWSLLATTVLVWFLAQGSFVAAVAVLGSPGRLLGPQAVGLWAIGAVGALGLFVAAFVLSQAVGRGLLRLLAPRPLSWPAALPRPDVPARLLAFPSERPDAFTFTLLHPSLHGRWSREEVVLVSEGLIASLTAEEQEAVIAHELGHVRDLDGRYLTFLRTFARLMRWDPILATVAAKLTRREEFRADEAAVALTHRPRALARAIYKATVLPASSTGALAGLLGPGGSAGRRQAYERIRRLVALAESGRFEE